ncbi:active breakpoint cluster region-related protein isoform X1 [Astyanax mexicanus]|uniref:Si:dkey-33c9.6 n=1 Tax=Astyanax mexicanus TaxID=7994 RepID=W5L122_ASTMX|nr:active breakpoint cluster region-related protein isoform X1 [Astyanax mexicanus]
MELYSEALQYLTHQGLPEEEEVEDVVGSDMFPDVFSKESDWIPNSDVPRLPDTPTYRSTEDMLLKRLLVLREILISEETYLSELETLLTPMKALRASAGTSQPVLSIEQVQTVFYQLPELRDLHREFHSSLKAKLQAVDLDQDVSVQMQQNTDFQVSVGDLFLKFVSQLGFYRGFIDNYESAVQIVRRCTLSNPRFRILAESMMSTKGPDSSRTKYTFEALLYKPLDRVTKTTLVLHDLLKHTPDDHHDSTLLQEALRLSSSFLSGVNEDSQHKTAVTLSRGERRQLVRDGFVVDVYEGGRNLRHLFLYTDLLLCVKLKGGTVGKPVHYRFCWYMPLAGIKMHWAVEQETSAELQLKISNMRAKMFHCRRDFQEYLSKGSLSRAADRCRRKLEACELWLLTHSPSFILELQSTNSKSHTIHLPSLYELEEWREAINKLKAEGLETVPPDLLSLANSCVKLRMTQQPPLCCLQPDNVGNSMCGSLCVVVHSACGLQQPASIYVCIEVDGFEIFDRKAKTCLSSYSLTPHWDQELVLKVDGARHLRLLCLSQSEEDIMGKATLKLDPVDMLKKWKKMTLNLGLIEVTISIKYNPHPLDPPSFTPLQQKPVFCVLIGDVASQEGVLVPHIVRSCVEEVERRGMEEEGIYRISGASSAIQALKHAFDTNYWEAMSKLRSVDVNVVSGTLKLYLRELPETLIPTDHFQSLSKALDLSDPYLRAGIMLSELQSFPDVNRNTLLFLLHHLKRVAKKEEQNKMSLSNLATVFGPSLLRPPVSSLNHCGPPVDISQEVEVQVQVINLYLQNQNLPEALTTKTLDIEEET